MSKFMTTEEVADLVRAPIETVRYWRHIGKGPASFKVGRRVLYAVEDVDAWIDGARSESRCAVPQDVSEVAQTPSIAIDVEPGRRRRLTSEVLKRAASIYQANLNDRPGEAVQTAYSVSPRQAARYIRVARDKGFLPPTTQGKATGWA